jgi:hypothetical protein
MKYIIDIDGTICNNTFGDYFNAIPYHDRINHFNSLFDQGHEIHYWTARGSNSGLDWYDFTMNQLSTWGVKYTSARVGKPAYDFWIDDKATNVDIYFKTNTINRS